MSGPAQARRALAAALPRREALPHLSEEEIAAYHHDRLAGADAERVAEHLVECPECSQLLLAYADFADPAEARPLSELELAAAWRVVRPASAPAAFSTTTPLSAPAAPAAPAVRARPARGLPWRALAASFLVAALGLGFYAQYLFRGLAQARSPELNSPVVDLFATGTRSASPEKQVLRLPAGIERLTVVLNPERRENFADYGVELRAADGSPLWQGRGLTKNAFGSFTLSLPRHLLRGEAVEISLFGLTGERREPLGTYELRLATP